MENQKFTSVWKILNIECHVLPGLAWLRREHANMCPRFKFQRNGVLGIMHPEPRLVQKARPACKYTCAGKSVS